MKIKTDNSGVSSAESFRIPLGASDSYNFSVDWGDGTAIQNFNFTNTAFVEHSYAQAGVYNVSISENVESGFPRIFFNNGGDKLKVIEIVQWGRNLWQSFLSSFYGCSNLIITATDHATAKTENVKIFSSTWRGCSSIVNFPSLNLSSATTVSNAWRGCSNLRNFPEINFSSVTNFASAWQDCFGIPGFPAIDMRSMTNGSFCFSNCVIPTNSYSAILDNLAQYNNNINITFNAGTNTYLSSSQSSRDILTDKSWKITDGGSV
jgi:hypothetical protein